MNSQVCIDANLIIRALVPGELTSNVLALLNQWQEQRMELIAPSLLAFEVTSVLRRMVYLNVISSSDGEQAFQEFIRFNVRTSSRPAIYSLAWQLAKQFNRPRTYDVSYLAVARLHNCDFWTADEKLFNAVQHDLSWVKWVGNYPT